MVDLVKYAKFADYHGKIQTLDTMIVAARRDLTPGAAVRLPQLGVGTRFLAAFSWLPSWLDCLGVIARAGMEVQEYEDTEAAQLASSKECLVGFVAALKASYGQDIYDLCDSSKDLNKAKKLTARMVSEALSQANQIKTQANQLEMQAKQKNAAVLDRYLNAESPNGLDSDVMAKLANKCLLAPGQSWRGLLGPGPTGFVKEYVTLFCREQPEYSQGTLSATQLKEAADFVIRKYVDVEQGLYDNKAEFLAALFTLAKPKATSQGMLDAVDEGLVKVRKTINDRCVAERMLARKIAEAPAAESQDAGKAIDSAEADGGLRTTHARQGILSRSLAHKREKEPPSGKGHTPPPHAVKPDEKHAIVESSKDTKPPVLPPEPPEGLKAKKKGFLKRTGHDIKKLATRFKKPKHGHLSPPTGETPAPVPPSPEDKKPKT